MDHVRNPQGRQRAEAVVHTLPVQGSDRQVRSRALTAILVAGLLGLGPACRGEAKRTPLTAGEDPAPAAAPPPPAGDAGRRRAFDAAVLEAKPCKPKPWVSPPDGLRNVGVFLEVRATGARGVPANPFYARLVDAEERTYRAQLGGCEPALSHRPLSPGERVRGWVTFEVPERISRVTFRYDPFLADGGSEPFTTELDL